MNKIIKKIFKFLMICIVCFSVLVLVYIGERYNNKETYKKSRLVVIEDKNGEVLTYHVSDSLNIVKFIIKEDKIYISEKVLGRWREQFDISIDRK